MRVSEFQETIINDAIIASHASYSDCQQKRDGFRAGLEACRDQSRDSLSMILVAANTAANLAVTTNHQKANEAVAFRAAVEWVCDCVSAVLMNLEIDPIISTSPEAWAKAANTMAKVGLRVAVVQSH